jgi:AcrR family transcriptional regulator
MSPAVTNPERERIVAAARQLVESGGARALTMRKLAAELGVAHTSIYWHVGSRDDVLAAVVESFLADAGPIRPQGRTPRRRMASIAWYVHGRAMQQRELVALAIERAGASTLWDSAHVALTREVEAVGLTGAKAGKAVTTILYVAGAFVTLEATLERQRETRANVALARQVFADALDAVLDTITGD